MQTLEALHTKLPAPAADKPDALHLWSSTLRLGLLVELTLTLTLPLTLTLTLTLVLALALALTLALTLTLTLTRWRTRCTRPRCAARPSRLRTPAAPHRRRRRRWPPPLRHLHRSSAGWSPVPQVITVAAVRPLAALPRACPGCAGPMRQRCSPPLPPPATRCVCRRRLPAAHPPPLSRASPPRMRGVVTRSPMSAPPWRPCPRNVRAPVQPTRRRRRRQWLRWRRRRRRVRRRRVRRRRRRAARALHRRRRRPTPLLCKRRRRRRRPCLHHPLPLRRRRRRSRLHRNHCRRRRRRHRRWPWRRRSGRSGRRRSEGCSVTRVARGWTSGLALRCCRHSALSTCTVHTLRVHCSRTTHAPRVHRACAAHLPPSPAISRHLPPSPTGVRPAHLSRNGRPGRLGPAPPPPRRVHCRRCRQPGPHRRRPERGARDPWP